MRISVYRLHYHTITRNEKGAETSRTSPEVATVAAESLAAAVASLPERPKGVENVLIQSHILQHDVYFREMAAPGPAAKVRETEPMPKIPLGTKV